MNTESDNFTTPKQTKRLGLRRSTKSIKRNENNATGSAAKTKSIEFATSTSVQKVEKTPQSDVKVNYKNVEQNDGSAIPGTPKSIDCGPSPRLSVSTNCRPYRLALSKRVREKMTKKRLEFFLANGEQNEEVEDLQVKQSQGREHALENNAKSREDLLKLIENASRELESRQQHVKKVQELKQAIEVWKTGFNLAMRELQQKIEPRPEIGAILDELHIPQDMIKYIED